MKNFAFDCTKLSSLQHSKDLQVLRFEEITRLLQNHFPSLVDDHNHTHYATSMFTGASSKVV